VASAGCKGTGAAQLVPSLSGLAAVVTRQMPAQAGEQKDISKKTAAEGRPRSTFRAFFRKPPSQVLCRSSLATL